MIDKTRFVALDSLRGACACAVVLLHGAFIINTHLLSHAVSIRNIYLCVDFFFVLSGFVIASAYEGRLLQGKETLGSFLTRRLGRIYPLHAAVLFGFLATRAAFAMQPGSYVFNGYQYTQRSFLVNLFLAQGLGIERVPTWNFPSWSIGAELVSYIVFGGFCLVAAHSATARKWFHAFWIAVLLISPAVLLLYAPRLMDSAYEPFALVRCLFGFAAGVLTYRAYRALAGAHLLARLPGPAWNIAEGFAVVASVLFIWSAGQTPWAVLAPLLFSLAILAFAMERGRVSAFLRQAPFVLLGTLSYSIYMVHDLVFASETKLASIWNSLHLTSVVPVPYWWTIRTPNELRDEEVLGATPWIGDLILSGDVVLVLVLAAATYALIEKPGRQLARRLADRMLPGRSPAAARPGAAATGA